MFSKIKQLFFVFLGRLDILSEMPLKSLAHFSVRLSVLFVVMYKNFLYIMDTSHLLTVRVVRVFYQSVASLFMLFMVAFDKQNLLIFKLPN